MDSTSNKLLVLSFKLPSISYKGNEIKTFHFDLWTFEDCFFSLLKVVNALYFTDKWSFAEVVIKREREEIFFLNHKLYQAGWVVCMPQRMIVCRGRVQKGDILDSHSLPSVIIQSTVIKISKLIFLQSQMFIWSCIFPPNIYWKTTLNMGRHSTREWKLYPRPRPSCTTHIFCLKLNPFYWCLM